MTTALLEIVDLGDGEVVLQRAEEEGVEPLVSIQFSAEASAYLMENNLEVEAKAIARSRNTTAKHTSASASERTSTTSSSASGNTERTSAVPNKSAA